MYATSSTTILRDKCGKYKCLKYLIRFVQDTLNFEDYNDSTTAHLDNLLQIFFYSDGIFKNAGVSKEQRPLAVIGTNAVNVAMTVVSVSMKYSYVS